MPRRWRQLEPRTGPWRCRRVAAGASPADNGAPSESTGSGVACVSGTGWGCVASAVAAIATATTSRVNCSTVTAGRSGSSGPHKMTEWPPKL